MKILCSYIVFWNVIKLYLLFKREEKEEIWEVIFIEWWWVLIKFYEGKCYGIKFFVCYEIMFMIKI